MYGHHEKAELHFFSSRMARIGGLERGDWRAGYAIARRGQFAIERI
jgi:hypothetical protein